MALQAVIHQHDVYGYSNKNKDAFNLLGCGSWEHDFDGIFDIHRSGIHEKNPSNILEEKIEEEENSPTHQMAAVLEQFYWAPNAAPESNISIGSRPRSRRRRNGPKKNEEEIENQRVAHIEVERNRRKQMNEYLFMLRGLMPDYYVLKADQASIIGGAINYVKELQQQIQFLGSLKYQYCCSNGTGTNEAARSSNSNVFAEFFNFPQYFTSNCDKFINANMSSDDLHGMMNYDANSPMTDDQGRNRLFAAADIEVTKVESHANLKVRSKKRPKQLLKMVSGLQSLSLTILHLNVTTLDQIVLYSLSLKVEDECNLSSVNDIAAAVNQILSRIQEEESFLA